MCYGMSGESFWHVFWVEVEGTNLDVIFGVKFFEEPEPYGKIVKMFSKSMMDSGAWFYAQKESFGC